MAEEHVSGEPSPDEWLMILQGGAERFNEFRDRNPGWRPLFPKNADLRRAKLSRANLKDAYLLGARLNDAELIDAQLQGADLLEAHLDGADLGGAQMQGASLWWAHLNDADLYRAKLTDAQMQNASLRGANLVEADLTAADLRSARMQGVNLSDATLRRAYLSHVDLHDADLRGACLENANILGADFRGARVNRASSVLSDRRAFQLCGDNPAADADALMQWAQLYKTHGAFELAGHCYYRARQHYRRERAEGLRVFSAAWFWGKFVSILERVLLDWSCAYGERPGGVLLWALVVILLSAYVYSYNSYYFLGWDARPMPARAVTAVYFSTVTFTTLGFGDFHPIQTPYPNPGWWLPLYVSIEAVTGALLMSLFLVTFARIMIRD